jgi:hypothetical protein
MKAAKHRRALSRTHEFPLPGTARTRAPDQEIPRGDLRQESLCVDVDSVASGGLNRGDT